MLDTLKRIADNYETLQEQMYQPEVASDINESMRINMELSSLRDAYELYNKMKVAHDQEVEARELLELGDDDEIIELAKAQLDEATALLEQYTQEAKIVLLPKDPNDKRNIYLEIRPAAGGDEAGLFAAELLRMYLRYAEEQSWKPEIIEHESSGIG
jgi:peptide chain release factor 1